MTQMAGALKRSANCGLTGRSTGPAKATRRKTRAQRNRPWRRPASCAFIAKLWRLTRAFPFGIEFAANCQQQSITNLVSARIGSRLHLGHVRCRNLLA